MQAQTKVQVKWRSLEDEDDDGWRVCGCLYAYLEPDSDEILYIGKSWGVTVRGRWNRASKEKFWDDLESERGIDEHIALIGEIWLMQNEELTDELLSDIESLLIQRISPWGNIQSVNSRISRPGLIVKCSGDWPHPQKTFYDR